MTACMPYTRCRGVLSAKCGIQVLTRYKQVQLLQSPCITTHLAHEPKAMHNVFSRLTIKGDLLKSNTYPDCSLSWLSFLDAYVRKRAMHRWSATCLTIDRHRSKVRSGGLCARLKKWSTRLAFRASRTKGDIGTSASKDDSENDEGIIY